MFTHIAIDWGSVSMGLAVGDSATGLILPLQGEYNPKNILKVVENELKNRTHISTIVVGIPTSFHGNFTSISTRIRDFINTLEQVFPSVAIVTVNERSTTQRSVAKIGIDAPKHQIDNQAASEILENYLLTLQKSN